MSEGLTTSSAESLSFHAFWMKMQPQLFHISTLADRGTLLSAAVPMVQALPGGGAAMFMRSTPSAPASPGIPTGIWRGCSYPRNCDHIILYSFIHYKIKLYIII